MRPEAASGPANRELPKPLRRRRRRLVAGLLVAMLLTLGPVWGVFYTLCIVLHGVLTSGSELTLTAVRQVTISLKPTLIGIAVAPVGLWMVSRIVLRLADLRKEAWRIEAQR